MFQSLPRFTYTFSNSRQARFCWALCGINVGAILECIIWQHGAIDLYHDGNIESKAGIDQLPFSGQSICAPEIFVLWGHMITIACFPQGMQSVYHVCISVYHVITICNTRSREVHINKIWSSTNSCILLRQFALCFRCYFQEFLLKGIQVRGDWPTVLLQCN